MKGGILLGDRGQYRAQVAIGYPDFVVASCALRNKSMEDILLCCIFFSVDRSGAFLRNHKYFISAIFVSVMG